MPTNNDTPDNIAASRARMAALAKPFTPDRIEWRVGSCGEKQDGTIWARVLAYIDNRAAMERLDEVFAEDWNHREEFATINGQAVCVVTIQVNIGNNEWRTVTGTCAVEANGDIDPFKSAASGAMKRAVVNLGVGRYLYSLDEAWAEISDRGRYSGKTKTGKFFKWNPPALPSWALPGSSSSAPAQAQVAAEPPADLEIPPFEEPEVAAPVYLDPSKVKFKEGAFAPAKPQAAAQGNTADHAMPIEFGKHKGKTLGQMLSEDRSWLEWFAKKELNLGKNGKPFAKDVALRDAANRLLLGEAAPAAEPAVEDNVPF